MKTIVIASQKGGAGKTTLAGHLAVAAEQAGAGPVALLDTDPQGSLAAWWNERTAETPAFAHADLSGLASQLAELEAAGVQLCIIDTPPAVTVTIRQVLAVADLVLIPTRPSPHDLRAVGSTVQLVEAGGKRMVFVINGAAHRARITTEAAIALSQHGAVAPTVVYQRTDFASSMIDGRTVQELYANGRSAGEISALWQYVSTQLNKHASA
ncbi:ParA family protein [Thiomonas intermedia]|uniref:ParA family protein n=1 Tax=Thiomonas intermedia TaxID=926 RepID=UPI0009A47322|nr:ParA family protein [Thiomonas intermedia]